jgi:hypothetical protein
MLTELEDASPVDEHIVRPHITMSDTQRLEVLEGGKSL